jgi:hypothetical protein
MGFHKMLYLEVLLKSVKVIQQWLKLALIVYMKTCIFLSMEVTMKMWGNPQSETAIQSSLTSDNSDIIGIIQKRRSSYFVRTDNLCNFLFCI